jgi:hypothetical protein
VAGLPVPITHAPRATASWTAALPTLPEAPLIRTALPAPTPSWSSARTDLVDDACRLVAQGLRQFLVHQALALLPVARVDPGRAHRDPDIGHLCAAIDLPEPEPSAWRQQIISVCAQLRDQYLRYPGISRAAFAVAPSNLDTLRVSEGMLGILLAGGASPQAAAWALDSLLLYVSAYSLEASLADHQRQHGDDGWVASRDELLRRFDALPDTFPHTKRYAAELAAGTGHDRFDFAIALMIDGIAHR